MRVPFSPAELETLLGRPVRQLLTAADRKAFRGQRVLITGGGGSVGSELARQIADCGPAALTLVDHSELALFEILGELKERAPQVAVEPVLADVCRARLMRRTLLSAAPAVVFHAAAYKHVGMVERDVCAGVAGNVIGTVNVVRYDPTGLLSSGTAGILSGGKGYWTLVYIGVPYPCTCQLPGTAISSHTLTSCVSS